MVTVLLITGDHVPLMPLLEIVGSVNDPPAHIGDICVNAGVSWGIIIMVIIAVAAQG